jgi:hypothetical protein
MSKPKPTAKTIAPPAEVETGTPHVAHIVSEPPPASEAPTEEPEPVLVVSVPPKPVTKPQIKSTRRVNVTEYMNEGYTFYADEAGINAKSPSGGHGHGPTAEDAVLNIGARTQTVDGQQVIVRVDGTVIDASGAPVKVKKEKDED